MTAGSYGWDLAGLDALISSYGVVGSMAERANADGFPMHVAVANVGGLVSARFAHRSMMVGYGWSVTSIEHARTVAVAEGAERYASNHFQPRQIQRCSYEDLPDGSGLDWRTYPRPSASELADPACHIRPFDANAGIRWIRGKDLRDGTDVWVPYVMVCYGLAPMESERFVYQISTGSAVHRSRDEALLHALCEVMERDALAVTWLQQLPLRRLDRSAVSDRVWRLIEWCDDHFVGTYLYSADLRLGCPVVLCLQVARHDDVCRQSIGAGTGVTDADAAERATCEALASRATRWTAESVPQRIEDFADIHDGARFMAAAHRGEAFDFLDQKAVPRRLAHAVDPLPAEPGDAVDCLVSRLSALGMRAVWVDCTTADLAAVGLWCVRVVVPELQPMCLRPPLAFRAHPRLYSAPLLAGYEAHPEEELNPWPHPMA